MRFAADLGELRNRILERENRLWDESRGLDTRGWLVPSDETTVGALADGFPYAATHVRLGHALLQELRPLARGATFLDLGSGKGRMLVLAAELPFADVIGVEYSRDLHETASTNLAAAELAATDKPTDMATEPASHWERAAPRSMLLDVREFVFPETPLVVYFNNPFPEPLMKQVLSNLGKSYERDPRPVALVYQQLRNEDAEHATRNRELLGALPFLTSQPLRLRGPLNRALLSTYAIDLYVASGTESRLLEQRAAA
jgi:SAM-dependent methyltransferase